MARLGRLQSQNGDHRDPSHAFAAMGFTPIRPARSAAGFWGCTKRTAVSELPVETYEELSLREPKAVIGAQMHERLCLISILMVTAGVGVAALPWFLSF